MKIFDKYNHLIEFEIIKNVYEILILILIFEDLIQDFPES
jgi:hypothetical protein